MQWKLTYQGETYPENDLTLDQIERLEEMLEMSWLEINPVRSAQQAKRVLAVVHSDRTGRPFQDVLDEVGKMSVGEWGDTVFTVDAVDDLPTQFENGTPQ